MAWLFLESRSCVVLLCKLIYPGLVIIQSFFTLNTQAIKFNLQKVSLTLVSFSCGDDEADTPSSGGGGGGLVITVLHNIPNNIGGTSELKKLTGVVKAFVTLNFISCVLSEEKGLYEVVQYCHPGYAAAKSLNGHLKNVCSVI